MYNPLRPVAARAGSQLITRAQQAAAAGAKKADPLVADETVYVAKGVFHEDVRVVTGVNEDGFKQFGLQWKPGFTDRLAAENKEVNAALIERVKAQKLTVGEAWKLAQIGLGMFMVGSLGIIAGRRKLFGWKNDPAAH